MTHPRESDIEKNKAAQLSGAVAAIGQIEAVPTLLHVLCDITAMRVAMVIHIAEKDWTVCAVRDELNLGLSIGGTAPRLNLDLEAQFSRAPIVVEHLNGDARSVESDGRGRFQAESYISVPIYLSGGLYFGSLCAFDTDPKGSLKNTFVLPTFQRFASLIAAELSSRLQRQQDHAELLDQRAVGELREQFIAILGHDLRGPLQAVFAGSDMLQRKLTDPALALIASRIKTSARRMSLLIDDVLDFAHGRLGSGIGLVLTQVENINAGLASVVQELQVAQPDCRIISNIAVNRPVRCDLGKLQQIVSNLLSNALTHGSPHRPVTVSALADEKHLVLDVWNAGEPIPAKHIDKVFDPFWRGSTSASRQGLGLGLHICAQIVKAHAGELSVISTREHGTQFTVRLPLSSPSMASAVSAESNDKVRSYSTGGEPASEQRAHSS